MTSVGIYGIVQAFCVDRNMVGSNFKFMARIYFVRNLEKNCWLRHRIISSMIWELRNLNWFLQFVSKISGVAGAFFCPRATPLSKIQTKLVKNQTFVAKVFPRLAITRSLNRNFNSTGRIVTGWLDTNNVYRIRYSRKTSRSLSFFFSTQLIFIVFLTSFIKIKHAKSRWSSYSIRKPRFFMNGFLWFLLRFMVDKLSMFCFPKKRALFS